MKMDQAKLEAGGFTVELIENGALINGVFVPMEGDELKLVTARSAHHRQINAVLGGLNPKLPEGSGV